jgi:hypothetical protein
MVRETRNPGAGDLKDEPRNERVARISFGPCPVPVVPYSRFTKMPADIDASAVWRVIGPTVGRNFDRPLWLQFVAVYLEGLNHGAGVMEACMGHTEAGGGPQR